MTISVPEITNIADVFQLSWKPEAIDITIDRLSERSDGVTAEILIKKSGGHLYHARFNLLSSNGKQQIINSLSKRFNSIDWQAIMEQTCTKTLQIYRKGQPVVNLNTLPARPSRRYRLYPFILEGERSILYGYGGSGKSKMSQVMGLLTQMGIDMAGMRPVQGNVLILDWETSEFSVKEWLDAVKNGMHIDSDEMPLYRYCTRGLADDIVEIQRVVMEHDIKLVIVDSVGMAIGGDAESQDMTRMYFNALRSLKISSLSIDHKPKKGNSIYGSVYKTNIARATFELKGTQTAGSNVLDIGIFHRKANDVPLIKPIGFHIDFTGDEEHTESVTISKQDVSDIPELEQGLSYKQQIIHTLKHGAMETKDIAEAISSTEAIVRTTLNRNRKIFLKNEKGEWGLLSSYKTVS